MVNRDKQKVALLKAAAAKKEQTREKVLKAVQELQQTGTSITFQDIARVAGVSKSYLYKWPEIKACIQDARDTGGQQVSMVSQEKESGPYSLRTLHEIDRNRIQTLESEIEELKRQNQLLLGHVAEIYELRDECERLRSRVRELTNSPQKAVVLQAVPTKAASRQKNDDIPEEILNAVEGLGIKLGVRLAKSIREKPAEQVIQAIKAFEQYRLKTVVENPTACLKAMIEESAEPNVRLEPSAPEDKEFDVWYANAIREGCCLNIPKRHLSKIGSEYQVKVVDSSVAGGYLPMPWKEARAIIMKKS